MTGPLRPGTAIPVTGTVTVQPEGPVADAVDQVTDGSVAAGTNSGGEVYGPPIPFEKIAELSDEELNSLADQYGIDRATGIPKGLLIQAIHERMTSGAVPVQQPDVATNADAVPTPSQAPAPAAVEERVIQVAPPEAAPES